MPRRYKLTISRSLKHITGQVVDLDGKIVACAASKGKPKQKQSASPPTGASPTKVQIASEIGRQLAKKLKTQKIKSLWFDRKGKKYHGRIKALIETLRKEGIKI